MTPTMNAAHPGLNGGAGPAQSMQINPNEVTYHLLMFLQRVEFRASERVAFDQCEMVLQALRAGSLIITSPPPKEAPPPVEPPIEPKDTN